MEVLDIRNGIRPGPLNYSPTYWRLVAAGKNPSVEKGETISLLERFRRANFSDEELALLQAALERSDQLVNLERQAFAAVEGLYDDGNGNFTVRRKPDREFAIRLLFNDRYIAGKAAIMEPIQKFMDLFSERMYMQSHWGLARLERQIIFEIVLIFVALLATTGIIFYTRL